MILRLVFLLAVGLFSCKSENEETANGKVKRENATVPTSLPGVQMEVADQIAEFVVEIFEDSKGNLWFGTMSKGAARYDGQELSYVSTKDGLMENTVVTIAEDHSGSLWFGTHSGASRYFGKIFTNYGAERGLPGAGCNMLVDSKGNIWAATNHGVFRFDGNSFYEFHIPNPDLETQSYKWERGKVWSLMEDREGNMWFSRDGYGACRYDGQSFTHFTKKDGLCSNNVSKVIEDRKGNIWFASLSSDFPEYVQEGGLSRYDGKTIIQFPELKGLSENDIYTIYEDQSGNVWIGATGHGVYRFDGEKFRFFNKTDRPDLASNFGVQSILEDRNGILWFGFSGGLFRFDGESFVNVTQEGPWE